MGSFKLGWKHLDLTLHGFFQIGLKILDLTLHGLNFCWCSISTRVLLQKHFPVSLPFAPLFLTSSCFAPKVFLCIKKQIQLFFVLCNVMCFSLLFLVFCALHGKERKTALLSCEMLPYHWRRWSAKCFITCRY
jgi:hypothetical protein